MKEGNVVTRIDEHFVEWSADEFAATDDGNFLMV